jgi:Rrf2 family transcriptional regulator, iron-sulfur cluster assembly transcription factor
MISYGKTTQYAIAAASRLAEVYADEGKLSSLDIAKNRQLPQPVVAKVLTILSQAGIVTGNPGPRGGYCLARPPEQIRLLDVAECFERSDKTLTCPFGPTYCGTGNPCPLHQQIVALVNHFQRFLEENTLAVFTKNTRKKKQAAALFKLEGVKT